MNTGKPAGRSILQVHPTRRCNLRCGHCYTSSGPEVRGELPLDVLAGAIADAATLGYGQLAVSGGEPFLYSQLPGLLETAHAAGMTTTVTTNGTVLNRERLSAVAHHVDLLAISIDGPPASHNLIRNSPTAFDRVMRHLPDVRDAGIPFGFIFTLTGHNVDQLEWLVGMAAEQGAAAVHIHPLSLVGRAADGMRGHQPDGLELLVARVEAARLGAQFPAVRIHVDALTLDEIKARALPGPGAPLAELAPVLIVDDTARVMPLTHDLDRWFALGSLFDAPLGSLARSWSERCGPAVAELLETTRQEMVSTVVSASAWYDVLAARSVGWASAA